MLFRSNSDGSQYIGMPEKTELASLFIGLAALVDFLDGLVARLFKATSPMGKELDSLADVVSFGVAPGMILYQLLRMSFASQADGLDVSVGWLLPAMLIPCAAAYRLARFNIEGARGPGLLLRDIDGTQPGILHALKGKQVTASIGDSDTHRLFNLLSLLGGGGDDAAGVDELQSLDDDAHGKKFSFR